MKRIIILFFLCYTIPLIAQHTDPIQEAMANYDYETALSLIAQKKSTPPLLLQKGKALRGLGLTTEALATYQEIIRNDTTNTRAFIEAAECCRTLANYNQALKYYEHALDLNPENKYARIQYISLLLSQQKFREALGESSLMTEKIVPPLPCIYRHKALKGWANFFPPQVAITISRLNIPTIIWQPAN